MSGFQDNPFGEPLVDNPFADPAIQQVTQNNASQQRGLEDYNPFEEDGSTTKGNNTTSATAGARNLVTGAMSPPLTTSTSQSQSAAVSGQMSGAGPAQFSLEEFHRRQAELDRKAAELDRREREINNGGGGAARLNNWPPLPDKCCFQPCFYHDIDQEIRAEFQRIVRNLYYVWIMYAGVMCVNILGGLTLLFHNGDFQTFGLAIFYAFLFTPASFMCWYRPAYKAFRTDSSFDFMVFFFIFFCQVCVTIIQTIGLKGTGTCGFVMAISQFGGTPGSILIGIFLLIIACGYGTCAAAAIMMLTRIHGVYRSSDASVDKARAEFTHRFMTNQHVQQAATSAASAVLSSQMSSGGNSATTNSRY